MCPILIGTLSRFGLSPPPTPPPARLPPCLPNRSFPLRAQVKAVIATCGGLCPGLNNVVRQLVLDLYQLYGVHTVYGIQCVPPCPAHVRLWSRDSVVQIACYGFVCLCADCSFG